jgi:hypothetical protein
MSTTVIKAPKTKAEYQAMAVDPNAWVSVAVGVGKQRMTSYLIEGPNALDEMKALIVAAGPRLRWASLAGWKYSK